ncbi:hypothetical protein BEH94_06905 [Candidatus Altiarchaeales archaeon WOR_SM1_SCG]|nr:hypothetical protein BEH94_06905 [Candidatus Altiarchaeales archaeon WOR_SM1_SCG]
MAAGKILRSQKNIFTVAKWEIFRPAKSKFSLFSFIVLIASMIVLPLTLSNLSFEPGEMLIVGSYHLYKIQTNDKNLSEKLTIFPEFDVSHSEYMGDEKYDIYIERKNNIFNFHVADTNKGYSALSALKTNLEKLNNKAIDKSIEENESLRYLLKPVIITLTYIEQEPIARETIERIDEAKKTTGTEAGMEGEEGEEAGELIKNLTSSGKVSEVEPGDLNLPFPFENIFLSFILIAPAFFFSMFFASSLLRERIERRGEVILSAPLRNSEILAGKMLPYLILTTIVSGAASFFLENFTIFVVITIFILTVVLFTTTSLVVLLTRSPESANFILIFIYLGFFAYLFYPLMFAGIDTPDISMLSPITAMMQVEETGVMAFFEILYPSIFLSIILFIFSAALFKDDVLFTERNALDKVSDIYEFVYFKKIPYTGTALSGILVFPMVFVIEIFLLFLLFPLGYKFLFIVLPLMIIVEEFAKVFGVKSLILKKKIKNGFVHGIFAGLGFFAVGKFVAASIMEHVTPAGQALLTAGGYASGLSLHLAAALLVQMLCTGIAGYGLSKTNGLWAVKSAGFFAAAVLIHLAYYVFVITAML